MVQRWHQFSEILSTEYGYGTANEARRHVDRLNAQRAVNHYVATELEEGEEPFAGSLVVDLVSGRALPERHKQGPSQA